MDASTPLQAQSQSQPGDQSYSQQMRSSDPISLSGSASWTNRLKPPNHPSSRSDTNSYSNATSNATSNQNRNNYSTFGSTSDPAFGLSTQTARRRLLRAIERKIEEKEQSPDFTKEFRDPFALLLLVCAAFRIVDYARKDVKPDGIGPLLEGLFLLGAATVNVVLNALQRRRHHDEMAERVRTAVRHLLTSFRSSSSDTDSASDAGPPPLPPASSGKPTVLLPSTNLIACYRDAHWQRLPMNLLVDGDIVALMGGDLAPGAVHALNPPSAQSRVAFPRGAQIPSGDATKVLLADTERCNATFDASLLLSLCGGMRVFEMQETPVVQDIDDAFFRIHRPQTYTQKLQAQARLIAIYVCTLYSVVVLLAIGLRVVVQHRSLHTTLNHILQGPIGIWLCFASLNTPFVLFLAEAAATASILGSFESVVYGDQQAKGQASGATATASAATATGTTQGTNRPPSPTKKGGITKDHASDMYDSEEREKMRSEQASRQSAFRRSLAYFLITLRFRLRTSQQAHTHSHSQELQQQQKSSSKSTRPFLPIPFRSFRLLERLGSTTMLCCFDDDILCEQTPSVEEIFLLNDKQTNSSTVLDLHPDRDCETGLKFEDPKWRQHLASLKPIALSILLNDAEDPAEYYHASMRYLMSETTSASSTSTSTVNTDPYLRTCIQRLSAHVRMLPFPKHLLNLTREIGFCRDDLVAFRRLQALHIICPRLAHHEHTIDHHDQGQEDTRYRGNLKTHLYSTVVHDQRSNRQQLLSRGHPMISLAQCSEFWDGKSICPLTNDKRRAILEMYNQWRVEDLDCVALSYVPVPHKLSGLFTRAKSYGDQLANGMQPPVYLVEDSVAGEINFRETMMGATVSAATTPGVEDAMAMGGGGGSFNAVSTGSVPRGRCRSQPVLSPAASVGSNDDARRCGHGSQEMPQGMSSVPSSSRAISPTSRHRTERGLANGTNGTGTNGSTSATGQPLNHHSHSHHHHSHHHSDAASTSSMGPPASELLESSSSLEKDALLWQIQDDQIFLGMVATGVQPKRAIPDFIEDLTASGIRFVYFSPRNMRRSKLLAEKMGIETDWNCAISLRPLESDGPDPHRMTSNYSDWDVKARLPHGVDAIKRHLVEVDNVPLLVSLYTDSTTETISDMISIFQENGEVVMGVGSSLKTSNAALFAKADVAVALQTGLHTLFDEQLPRGSDTCPLFAQDDVDFSHILNTLPCSFSISSIPQLMELIRLGRSGLRNLHQMIAFIFVSQLFLATLILLTYIVPFPSVPQLSCGSIFWFLWGLVPVLSLSMLASPEEKDVMTRTPRKNEDAAALQDDLPRLTWYFVLRHVPSALVAVLVFEWIWGLSLQADRLSLLDPQYHQFTWLDFVVHTSALSQQKPRPRAVVAAIDRAEAAMVLVVGLSVISSSTSYLYRCESIFSCSPLRNRIWTATAMALLAVQLAISAVRAGAMSVDSEELRTFLRQDVPYTFWLFVAVWPLVALAIDEAVKSHDRHHITRYYKFLRMQFDTRLGMWSPK